MSHVSYTYLNYDHPSREPVRFAFLRIQREKHSLGIYAGKVVMIAGAAVVDEQGAPLLLIEVCNPLTRAIAAGRTDVYDYGSKENAALWQHTCRQDVYRDVLKLQGEILRVLAGRITICHNLTRDLSELGFGYRGLGISAFDICDIPPTSQLRHRITNNLGFGRLVRKTLVQPKGGDAFQQAVQLAQAFHALGCTRFIGG